MKRYFLMILMIAVSVCGWAQSQPQSQDNLVDRVSRVVGVRLPDGYEAKVKEFVTKSKVLEGIGGEFTETWIAGQMKTSWGIDRGNQLLFVWDAVYEQITKKNFYDGEDGNKKRLDEFEKVMDNIEACGKKFKEDFTAYMKQRSAEAERQSAEYKRQSAEALIKGVKEAVRFYKLYKNNPNTVLPGEIKLAKEYTVDFINGCKKYNIDYKAILRKELGDDKKVAELLKFYGVE